MEKKKKKEGCGGGRHRGRKEENKLDFIKIKNVSWKKIIKKMKRHTIGWEKLFAMHTSDKGLICKNKELNIKRQATQ